MKTKSNFSINTNEKKIISKALSAFDIDEYKIIENNIQGGMAWLEVNWSSGNAGRKKMR